MEKFGRAGQATHGNKTRRKRSACWITKSADTHSEYATIVLIAFQRVLWLYKRYSMLGYVYIASLV